MAVAGLHNVSAFSPSFFDDSRPNTRASALLQMWRELENEHVMSQSYRSRQPRNGSDTECSSTPKSVGQGSENGDDISRHSEESENQGFTGSETEHNDNNSVISEQWMNSGSKGHSTYEFRLNNRSGQCLGENDCESVRVIREWAQTSTEVGSRIEQVREGLSVSCPEIGARRRPIRRLCGRQTLLDLLLRAHSERKSELLGLAERRPVSEFAHRNRIQALLRGRFLRNEKLVLHERPSSRAATELGLLRQRQTVSDLREGFLSKLDNSASASVNSSEAESESSDGNNGESESTCREGEVIEIHTTSGLESCTTANRNAQELEVQVTEADNPVLYNETSDHDVSLALDTEDFTVANESSLECNDVNYSTSREVINENYDRTTTDLVGGNGNEEGFDSQDASARVEEFRESVEIEDDVAWQQENNTVAFTDVSRDDTARNWQEGSAYQSFGNNVEEEQDQIQESHEDWPSHDLQEAIDSWLDMPSGRTNSFYLPDDDDRAHSMELRELFSRRRVSSLLRSSFRESLDQVLQSHVERLGHASGDWAEQDQEELNGDHTLALSDGDEQNPFAPSSTIFAASQPLWDEELLQGPNWSHHNSNLHLETEWEVINELRIDMARLQQRMNNMQSMLEACMEMQIELQRSVQQEVSAALNRSIFSRDEDASDDDNRLHDESQWDHVRKGICLLCRDGKIDSLLYRCGHMCSCLKCAENLVRCKGKCPMCHAPAVEVVQAYFIQ